MISAGKFISDIGNHNDIITEMREILLINKQYIYKIFQINCHLNFHHKSW